MRRSSALPCFRKVCLCTGNHTQTPPRASRGLHVVREQARACVWMDVCACVSLGPPSTLYHEPRTRQALHSPALRSGLLCSGPGASKEEPASASSGVTSPHSLDETRGLKGPAHEGVHTCSEPGTGTPYG